MIKLKNITKEYKIEKEKIKVLENINIEICDKDFIAIMGASGSGKTTLLNIIGCMDRATSGEYYLDNKLVSSLDDKELSEIRGTKITFIFQNFALMEKYTAYENIELPLIVKKVKKSERKKKVLEVAKQLGIDNQLNKLPRQMSGGQQQRIAIARSLVSGADIILADEPTGNLDSKASDEIVALLRKSNKELKQTIIMITHNMEIAKCADRIIQIEDGKIAREVNS